MIRAREVTSRADWLEWRKSNINASEIAALFGNIHPYTTAYELWCDRSGLLKTQPKVETADMKRGRLQEPVLLQLLMEEFQDWEIRKTHHYFDDPEMRLGATPDFDADRPDRMGTGVIQGKVVRYQIFQRDWRDKDTGDEFVPPWIAIQASAEAYLSGATWAGVAAMVDVDLHYFEVPPVPALVPKFQELVADFWARVAENRPYDVDWGRDAEAVLQRFREEDGSTIDLSADQEFEDMICARRDYKKIEAEADEIAKKRRIIDAQIIEKLGNCQSAIFKNGGLLSAPTVRRKSYTVAESSYRRIKIKENVLGK